MPGDKETSKRTLLSAENTLRIWTQYDHEVRAVGARARVHIHAAEAPSGPDTLVLRTMDGDGKNNCTYWKKKPVADATPGDTDGLLTLDFTLKNDGTGEGDLDDCDYELAWRPTDDKNEEVLLVQDTPAEDIWQTDADEAPWPIATLMAARFYEAQELWLPDRDPDVFDDPWTPEPIREDPATVPDATSPLIGGSAVINSPHVHSPMPERESAAPMEAQTGGSTGEGPIDADAPPPGPRWVTLVRRYDDPPAGAEAGRTGSRRVDLVGTYKVTDNGKYKYATFEGEGSASATGEAQGDVLIPIGGGGTLFARLSMAPPTRARLRQQVDSLDKSLDPEVPEDERPGFGFTPIPSLTTLFEDYGLEKIAHVDTPSAAPSGAKGGVVYLPNPLAAAQRRFAEARDASERFAQWREKTKGTGGLVGLVGDTCFSEGHGRTYLQEALEKDPGTIEWGDGFLSRPAFDDTAAGSGTFSEAPETGDLFGVNLIGPEEGGLLGEVLYGYKCQQAFLKRRRDRAVEAARAVLGSPLYREAFYDVLKHPTPDAVSGVQQAFVQIESSLSGVGDGTLFLQRGLDQALGDGSTLEAVLGPLDEATGLGHDTLYYEEPTFKALFVMAQRSTKTLQQLVMGASPALLSVGMHFEVSVDVPAPTPLALLGGFLVTDTGGTGGVAARMNETADGGSALRVERSGAAVEFEQTPVSGLERRTSAVRLRWRAAAATELSLDLKKGARAVGVTPDRLQGAGTAFDVINVLIGGATLQAHYTEGRLQPADALAATKLLADTAGLAETALGSADELPGVARRLLAAAPALDAVEVTWNVAKAMAHEREEGLQTIQDPNVAGAAGHLAMATGSGLALGGLGLAAGLGGVALLGVGAALQWYQKWENVEERIESDPLGNRRESNESASTGAGRPSREEREEAAEAAISGTWEGWLPEQSQWGRRYEGDTGAREAVVNLVQPGQDKSAGPPPTDPIEEETKQFVEKAFTFPTAAGVPPKPLLTHHDWTGGGPPERLYLSIIPEYVPKTHGTFMVNATVMRTGRGTMGGSVDVVCAVHYVKTSAGVQYRVCQGGTTLTVPSDTSLSDHAEQQGWAVAEKELTPTPGGTAKRKLALPIHVGAWPTAEIDWSARSRVRSAHRSPTEPLPGNPIGSYDVDIQQAAEMLQKVPETARIDGPGGLTDVLQSGRFEVEGTISFNPFQPFDPNPTKDKYKGEDMPIAKEAIKFAYPRDASN